MHDIYLFLVYLWTMAGNVPVRCGYYTANYLRTERIADMLTFLDYMAFPIVAFAYRRKLHSVGYPSLVILMGLFILFCGSTHLFKVITGYYAFYMPASLFASIATGLVSTAAVFALYGALHAVDIPVGLKGKRAASGAARFTRIYTVILVSLLSVIGVGLWGYKSLHDFIVISFARREGIETARTVERMASLVRDAESGQRGYILTGDTAYLEPYRRALARTENACDQIRKKMAWEYDEVDMLCKDIDFKLSELKLTVNLMEEGRKDVAMGIVSTGEGRRRMIQIRNRAARLAADAERFSKIQEDKITRSSHAALLIIPIVFMFSFVTVGTSVVVGRSNFLRARAIERRADIETAWLESDRIAARDLAQYNADLLNSLSHDLKTPLNAITAQASLAESVAEDEIPDLPTVRDALREIARLSASQSELLESFLDVSRAERGEVNITVFPARAFLNDVINIFSHDAETHHIEIDFTCKSDMVIKTDRLKIKRILMNLIGNAVKFTPSGGVVWVEACTLPDHSIRFAVADTGPGIPPDVLPRLFRDFQQGNNPERNPIKGYGLGLAIVKRLCDQLGATVDVKTEQGRGSVFTVTLLPT